GGAWLRSCSCRAGGEEGWNGQPAFGGLIVRREPFRLRCDSFDEAGQNFARSNFDELSYAGGGHGFNRLDPVDATREVLDELCAAGLARGQRSGVGVGQQWRAGISEFDSCEYLAHALGGSIHQ